MLTKDESNNAIIQETQSNGDDENRPGGSQSTTKDEFQVNEVILLMGVLFIISLPFKLNNEAIFSLSEPIIFLEILSTDSVFPD